MNVERPSLVHIHYLRPPDREQIFKQYLVWDDEQVKVTYADGLTLESPVRIAGEIVLEAGSDVVWFTFPGEWHDIGDLTSLETVRALNWPPANRLR